MSSRREARERTMQALYAFELGSGDAQHVLENVIKKHLEKDPESLDFATNLFLRTIDFTEEADEIVVKYAQNWDISRIALVDRILLRLAMCEMLTFEDIPPKVTINEAIEVAKRYSTEKSGQFINGILDSVLVDFRGSGRMKKSGRGLVETDTVVEKDEENESN